MAGHAAPLRLDSRLLWRWAAIFLRFYWFCWGCWMPVAMYLMQSVASFSLWPLAINQSISRAVSVAVMLCSMSFLPPARCICPCGLGLGRFVRCGPAEVSAPVSGCTCFPLACSYRRGLHRVCVLAVPGFTCQGAVSFVMGILYCGVYHLSSTP